MKIDTDVFFKYVVILVLVFTAFSIIFSIGHAVVRGVIDKDKVVYMGKNDIGCDKYKYNHAVWFECPKEANVSFISEKVPFNRGSRDVVRPVFDRDVE